MLTGHPFVATSTNLPSHGLISVLNRPPAFRPRGTTSTPTLWDFEQLCSLADSRHKDHCSTYERHAAQAYHRFEWFLTYGCVRTSGGRRFGLLPCYDEWALRLPTTVLRQVGSAPTSVLSRRVDSVLFHYRAHWRLHSARQMSSRHCRFYRDQFQALTP